jgi:hypothetical protein
MVGNTATIYGSYMYPASTGPRYIPGGATNTAVCVLVSILALTLRYIHKHENKKLEKLEAEAMAGGGGEAGVAADGEDRRMAGFRYIY